MLQWKVLIDGESHDQSADHCRITDDGCLVFESIIDGQLNVVSAFSPGCWEELSIFKGAKCI